MNGTLLSTVLRSTTLGVRTNTFRIDGRIAVSRSIGDSAFKDNYGEGPEKQAISCIPDITETPLEKGDFFVLACDGLWDVFSNEEVIQFVAQNKTSKDIQTVAVDLVNAAIQKGSEDNITLIIVSID